MRYFMRAKTFNSFFEKSKLMISIAGNVDGNKLRAFFSGIPAEIFQNSIISATPPGTEFADMDYTVCMDGNYRTSAAGYPYIEASSASIVTGAELKLFELREQAKKIMNVHGQSNIPSDILEFIKNLIVEREEIDVFKNIEKVLPLESPEVLSEEKSAEKIASTEKVENPPTQKINNEEITADVHSNIKDETSSLTEKRESVIEETIPETVLGTISETIPETVPETIPETVLGTISETIPETVLGTVLGTISETVPETEIDEIMERVDFKEVADESKIATLSNDEKSLMTVENTLEITPDKSHVSLDVEKVVPVSNELSFGIRPDRFRSENLAIEEFVSQTTAKSTPMDDEFISKPVLSKITEIAHVKTNTELLAVFGASIPAVSRTPSFMKKR